MGHTSNVFVCDSFKATIFKLQQIGWSLKTCWQDFVPTAFGVHYVKGKRYIGLRCSKITTVCQPTGTFRKPIQRFWQNVAALMLKAVWRY
jgi:hypothetical protein